jgi:hypothetical protein
VLCSLRASPPIERRCAGWSKNAGQAQSYQSSLLTFEPFVFTPVFEDDALAPFFGSFPIFQPQERSVFTIFGVTAAVSGTRTKMNDLWIAYANASCVQMPTHLSVPSMPLKVVYSLAFAPIFAFSASLYP